MLAGPINATLADFSLPIIVSRNSKPNKCIKEINSGVEINAKGHDWASPNHFFRDYLIEISAMLSAQLIQEKKTLMPIKK